MLQESRRDHGSLSDRLSQNSNLGLKVEDVRLYEEGIVRDWSFDRLWPPGIDRRGLLTQRALSNDHIGHGIGCFVSGCLLRIVGNFGALQTKLHSQHCLSVGSQLSEVLSLR